MLPALSKSSPTRSPFPLSSLDGIPSNVIIDAVILEHDKFPNIEKRRVDVAVRNPLLDSQARREVGHDPGLNCAVAGGGTAAARTRN
jgi:hypothetical protein